MRPRRSTTAISQTAKDDGGNSDNIGLDDKLLVKLKPYKRGTFSPLADVADLVWRNTRKSDENNHFADMDKPGKDGKTLLQLCAESAHNIDPGVWNQYYAGIGENRRGALPFRVWQIFDAMVDYAKQNKKLEFVCAAGIVAHYVGDACQPLHISQYHHGRDLNDPKQTKVHSVYETTMIGRHGADLIKMIPAARTDAVAEIVPAGMPTGRNAAEAVVALMQRTVNRLPPLTIVDLFDAHMGRGQVDVMWAQLKDKTAACMQDGAKTLARIWEAAWRAGEGEDTAQGGKFNQGDLRKLYENKDFLPSYALQSVALDANDHIVAANDHTASAAPRSARSSGRQPAIQRRGNVAAEGHVGGPHGRERACSRAAIRERGSRRRG